MTDSEVFVCTRAHQGSSDCHVSMLGKSGFEGYVRCGFETTDYEEALAHVDVDGRCWVESHAWGDLNRPVLREMHGSDYGGVYVQDYRDKAKV